MWPGHLSLTAIKFLRGGIGKNSYCMEEKTTNTEPARFLCVWFLKIMKNAQVIQKNT
jgi:hypothetical protein